MNEIHRVMSKFRLTALTGVLLLAGGCSNTPEVDLATLAQVKGTVVYKGTPVRGARLTFRSKTAAEPAFGLADAQGNFTAMTNDTTGIFPGDYVVTVNHPQAKLPGKYADAESSPLKLTLAPGENREMPITLED